MVVRRLSLVALSQYPVLLGDGIYMSHSAASVASADVCAGVSNQYRYPPAVYADVTPSNHHRH